MNPSGALYLTKEASACWHSGHCNVFGISPYLANHLRVFSRPKLHKCLKL